MPGARANLQLDVQVAGLPLPAAGLSGTTLTDAPEGVVAMSIWTAAAFRAALAALRARV